MNTASDLKSRLLRLYPVSILKNHFQPVAKVQTDIMAEIIQRQDAEIIQFAFDNYEFTKQHVFLFEHDIPLATVANINLLPGFSISIHNINGQVDQNYLYNHEYVVHAFSGHYQKLNLNFRQPIRVLFRPGIVEIHLTILERNPASYLPGFEVFSYKRTEDDKEVVNKILLNFLLSTKQALIPLDLNKGVKTLWHQDVIDARSLKFKRSNSVVSEKMDEDFTFKTQYPDKFAEVMTTPLKKHLFHLANNGDADNYGDFECDPSEGTFSFNKYPTGATQIKDVISTIITNNV